MISSSQRRWFAPAYSLALSVAVLAPLLSPGYLLIRDAVSTPRSYLSDAALGLSGAAPRALPQDFLLAVLSAVVDGGVVVKGLLFGGLFLAGWGAARLASEVLPTVGVAGQLVACTVAVWNPYVAERLLQGHWSLLVGYGALPWVAEAVVRQRSDFRALAALVFWIALAGLTPTGLMLATTVALTCLTCPGSARLRHLVAILAATVISALPWLAATVLGNSLGTPQSGVTVFAARAEPGLGTLGSLAGLGGIWNSDAVPTSRTTLFAVVATAVLIGIVALGLSRIWRLPQARGLLVLAVVSVVVPAAMSTDIGLDLVRAVIDAAPGLGIIRDGQKWVALAMPGYAVASAAAVFTMHRWVSPAISGMVCAVALIAVLPDLTWGVGGKVVSVRYPAGWSAVAQIVNDEPGTVAVLPADTMRLFAWSGTAPVLDPLPRWLRSDVLATGDLVISGETVHGEGDHARRVQEILLNGRPGPELANAGVSWVVVERGSAGALGRVDSTLASLSVAYQDSDIALYRVDGAIAPDASEHRGALIAAHLAWLTLLLGSGAAMARLKPGADRSSGDKPR